jgi:hypothetical protein
MALPIGETEVLNGQVRVTAAEAIEHETDLKAKRFTEIPSNMQMRAQYSSTDGLPDYLGFAPKGLASGATGWLLQKFTYDGSRQCTLRQIAYDSWTNVATASYS